MMNAWNPNKFDKQGLYIFMNSDKLFYCDLPSYFINQKLKCIV